MKRLINGLLVEADRQRCRGGVHRANCKHVNRRSRSEAASERWARIRAARRSAAQSLRRLSERPDKALITPAISRHPESPKTGQTSTVIPSLSGGSAAAVPERREAEWMKPFPPMRAYVSDACRERIEAYKQGPRDPEAVKAAMNGAGMRYAARFRTLP
jgi:hypothetical protein